jgi:FtsH-binding integral membrane protein
MSTYPQPPPSYGASNPPPKSPPSSRDGASSPLLGGPSNQRSGAGAIYDQPYPDDLPDDFKYGVTVSESSPEIRNAFVRKVYSILFCQIAATTIVSGFLSQSESAIFWVQTHLWAVWMPLIATFVVLGLLFWKRHTHPLNLVLLSAFTLLEAFSLGLVVSFYDNVIVLQALIITVGVFLGLTLFTFQSKYDFSGMGPFLFGGLIALCVTGLVGVFLPFSRTFDLIMAIGGCLIFSGYIVYDTYMINNRLSPDEYIMGSISLYLDFINLFINILRLLNDTER